MDFTQTLNMCSILGNRYPFQPHTKHQLSELTIVLLNSALYYEIVDDYCGLKMNYKVFP